jgi:hypothetical protein
MTLLDYALKEMEIALRQYKVAGSDEGDSVMVDHMLDSMWAMGLPNPDETEVGSGDIEAYAARMAARDAVVYWKGVQRERQRD